MMDESQLKLEARLIALEYMIANAYVLLHRVFRSPPESILRTHETARQMLREQTFPGLDAAQSDLIAGEVQAAVEGMLSAIEEMVGLHKNPKS